MTPRAPQPDPPSASSRTVSIEGPPARAQYRTTPPRPIRTPKPPRRLPRPATRTIVAAAALLGVVVLNLRLPSGAGAGALTTDGRLTLAIFTTAVWAWVFTKLDDTYVALAAAASLVLLGVVDSDGLFSTLGDDTIWLLVSAFVIAAGVTSSGLATRAAAWLVTAARSLRALTHLVTAAIVVTAFAVPSTSGRAALTLPVFVALARTLNRPDRGQRRTRSVLVLALVFPTVILLSAVASLLGAGAHLVTSRVLATATGSGIDFVEWMLLGLPLAVVSSHLAAELILWLFTKRGDRWSDSPSPPTISSRPRRLRSAGGSASASRVRR